MNLATLMNGRRDGQLVVVSSDLATVANAGEEFPTLQAALDDWATSEPKLRALASRLDAGTCSTAQPFDPKAAAAPFPRAFQWADGSAFLNHGRLMQQAFNLKPNDETLPLIYQGGSDDFTGPHEIAHFPALEDDIDFEGELAVVVGDVPMGVSPQDAIEHVRLIMLLNDWSLRALAKREMATGFGFFQAKPATSFAPIAVTPDALGEAWRNGRAALRVRLDRNGERFGDLSSEEMDFSFGEIIAHAARTRNLKAGTIIGSGTVSNLDRAAGSACISERRMIEIIESGAARTGFMMPGERIRIEAFDASGRSVFGAIDQAVAIASPGSFAQGR